MSKVTMEGKTMKEKMKLGEVVDYKIPTSSPWWASPANYPAKTLLELDMRVALVIYDLTARVEHLEKMLEELSTR